MSFSSGAAVLGDSLGSFGDGVLGKLSWEEESDSRLDLSGGESVLLVVSHQLGGLKGNLFEDVVDERVHDVHRSLGDSGFGVHLLEDSVDVYGEGFGSSLLLFVLSVFLCSLLNFGSGGSFGGSGGLLGGHVIFFFD